MKPQNHRFIRSVVTMVGSVVGVGVFGLPYAFLQTGPALGALTLLTLAGLITALQLMYGDVLFHTSGTHRFPGIVRVHLGAAWGRFAAAAQMASMWGAMLAYMIVGGKFLHTLLSPVLGGGEWWYGVALAVVAALLALRGIQFVSRIELFVVGALLFLFAFIVLAALPYAHWSNFGAVRWDGLLVSYGVALFALSGMAAVPEMKAVLGKAEEKSLPHAVLVAMAIIAGLYLVFGLTVLAVLGTHTPEAAFEGLVPVLGGSFRVIASLLGSAVVLSIFSMIGVVLTNTFRFDFRVRPAPALVAAMLVPCLLYVTGVRELIDVLMFVGSVLGGTIGILVVLLYEKVRTSPVRAEHRCLVVPRLVSVALVAVFLTGMILTVAQIIS